MSRKISCLKFPIDTLSCVVLEEGPSVLYARQRPMLERRKRGGLPLRKSPSLRTTSLSSKGTLGSVIDGCTLRCSCCAQSSFAKSHDFHVSSYHV